MVDQLFPSFGRKQRLCLLGATGSIGGSTLDVIARHPDRFEVFALTGGQRVEPLRDLCIQWKPKFAVMSDVPSAQALRLALADARNHTEVLSGAKAIEEVASHPEVDVVMAALVGAAGLLPCLAAAKSGKRLLLANKEALVVGGRLFMDSVAQGGATLLPIDSEHSAIFQCLPAEATSWSKHIDHIVLTASGGPFKQHDLSVFSQLTPEQACAHPKWVMGRKISVDSATMMNKALEVIEARWLFGLTPAQIRVVIHPQSIIHSMVVCKDQSILAQMGTPDMRIPIAYGLAWPERIESGAARLDFLQLGQLTFEAPCEQRYPGLQLAWHALNGQEGATCVLNAANEVAVEAFLNRRIRFDQIHHVNTETLNRAQWSSHDVNSASALLALDKQARAWASSAAVDIAHSI